MFIKNLKLDDIDSIEEKKNSIDFMVKPEDKKV